MGASGSRKQSRNTRGINTQVRRVLLNVYRILLLFLPNTMSPLKGSKAITLPPNPNSNDKRLIHCPSFAPRPTPSITSTRSSNVSSNASHVTVNTRQFVRSRDQHRIVFGFSFPCDEIAHVIAGAASLPADPLRQQKLLAGKGIDLTEAKALGLVTKEDVVRTCS